MSFQQGSGEKGMVVGPRYAPIVPVVQWPEIWTKRPPGGQPGNIEVLRSTADD